MRKVNIASLCLPEIPDTTPEHNFERAFALIDALSTTKPDLICLPENFVEISVPSPIDFPTWAEKIKAALSQKAAELNTYIVAGLHDIRNGKVINSAVLFDRTGKICGCYIKHYPTDYEMRDKAVVPGDEIPVFDTDFGKIGVLICFDIDWPDIWRQLSDKGAELVVWISAYEGGYPLEAYAAANMYYVVSSVRGTCSKIIDKTGKIIAGSSRWINWVQRQIDLEKEIFHIDHQFDKLPEIQKAVGKGLIIENFDEAGRFTLQSDNDEWPVDRIIRQFQLETFQQYHARTETMQDKIRGNYL